MPVVIAQVSQPNAQMVMQRIRHADGEAKAEQSLRQAKREARQLSSKP
jgi:hypothetical protein